MKKVRDSQRSKVYAAERVFLHMPCVKEQIKEFSSIKECQTFVNATLKRKMVKRHFNHYWVPRVTTGARNGWAWSKGGRITVSPGSMNNFALTHEMAHELLPRSIYHGWQFAETELFLVRQVFGKEAERLLKEQFKLHRVKFRKPRKRTITPEQRAILVERMTMARAAKAARAA